MWLCARECRECRLVSSAQEDTEGGRLLFLAQSAAPGWMPTNMESCIHADFKMGLFSGGEVILLWAALCMLPLLSTCQNACTLSQPLILPGDIDPVFVLHPLDKSWRGEEEEAASVRASGSTFLAFVAFWNVLCWPSPLQDYPLNPGVRNSLPQLWSPRCPSFPLKFCLSTTEEFRQLISRFKPRCDIEEKSMRLGIKRKVRITALPLTICVILSLPFTLFESPK